ncbi:MAG: patatin [Chitinophagaceae bacterium]|nr:patatin [Chitinophagaceae bacterium]
MPETIAASSAMAPVPVAEPKSFLYLVPSKRNMRKLTFLLVALSMAYAVFPQPKYKNLVLEGGGVRGFAYVGALEVMDSIGILQGLERVGGTSAGAIQATLVAIGYSPAEIREVIAAIPLREFNDGSIAGGFHRLKTRFGFFKGRKLMSWVEQLIAAKTGDGNISFIELHRQKKEKHYKDLYITGTDLSYRCLRVFSYESYPNMKIKDALYISFAIPLYFEPVLIDDNGTVHPGKSRDGLHLMVDGGLLSNYPIDMFDDPKYFSADTPGTKWKNIETLGLLLDQPMQVSYSKDSKLNLPLPLKSFSQYINAVYRTVIDRPNPDEPGMSRTIVISDLDIPGRVRKLPDSEIVKLIESGKQGVRKYFSQ